MKLYVIADLHLSFGTPGKEMDVFGPEWENHPEKIAHHWKEMIQEDDLVLLPGDISWAKDPMDAIADLMWIHDLPGHKVMIRGNHESWWQSASKVRAILPSSIEIVHNCSVTYNNIAIAGSRMWDNENMDFSPFVDFQDPPEGVTIHKKPNTPEQREKDHRIFAKELARLRASLDDMDSRAKYRVVMTHYPPINPEHEENEITRLLQNEGISHCFYGHLHHLKPEAPTSATIGGVKFACSACDWLNFTPMCIDLSSVEAG